MRRRASGPAAASTDSCGRQETTAQLTVRLVVLLLITLSLLAAAFQFDVVLGAFAAGFVLRRIIPAGHQSLEHKLDGLAFGLLIPVFFVTSGMGIDPAAVASKPLARRLRRRHRRRAGGPIVVATMTSVAVSTGQMSDANSSLLVAGGAVTVLLLPMTATLLYRPAPDDLPIVIRGALPSCRRSLVGSRIGAPTQNWLPEGP